MAQWKKYLPANAEDARDAGLIPGLRRSPGEGKGNLLQYSCWENPMDRGAWCHVLVIHSSVDGLLGCTFWPCE